MILDRLVDFRPEPLYARVSDLLGSRVELLLKLEGFNPGGSVKMKPAVALVRDLQRRGLLQRGSVLIDTTSGNMGIALAMIARSMGYGFVCVADEKITEHNRKLIRAYGAELAILPRSTLDERYEYIRKRIAADRRLVWTRQFENAVNPAAHETTTALEILRSVPRVDHLFAGVGTGGTLAGCARVFRERSPSTRIVAVDALGSRHFDDSPVLVPRSIPGIGATRRSPFIDGLRIDDVVIVSDESAVRHCKLILDRTGWLLGGSSGSVVGAILASASRFRDGDTVVGICADFGERYLDSVYRCDAAAEVAAVSASV